MVGCAVCVSSYKYGDGLKDAKGHGANTGGGLTRDPRGESGRAEARQGQSRRDDGTDGHERMEWGTADAHELAMRGPAEKAQGSRQR